MKHVKLVVVGGATQATEILIRPPVVLGRGREASIPLPHPLVSRLHCEIVQRRGRLVVRDLGSLNGTFVGNQRVSESVLPPGELLTVGSVTFRAEYEVDADLLPPTEGPVAAASSNRADEEFSQLSASDLPPALECQLETGDHPLDNVAFAVPVSDDGHRDQGDADPPALTEGVAPTIPDRADEKFSQLSASDLPPALECQLETDDHPLDNVAFAVPVSDDGHEDQGDSDPPAPSEESVEPVSEAEPKPSRLMSDQETRDLADPDVEADESTPDASPKGVDSLDFSVAPESEELDRGGPLSNSPFDSIVDEDLRRFLSDLD